jgi:hypothetical protein
VCLLSLLFVIPLFAEIPPIFPPALQKIVLFGRLQPPFLGLSAQGQDCDEIGRLIVDVAETATPNLRYQTSQKVQDTVAKKLVDLSGNKMRDEQITFFKSLIE